MSDDKMQVGNVVLNHGLPQVMPPLMANAPKRVAVQASVYADRLTVRIVVTANDGTVWLRSRDNWERLPDLPQE